MSCRFWQTKRPLANHEDEEHIYHLDQNRIKYAIQASLDVNSRFAMKFLKLLCTEKKAIVAQLRAAAVGGREPHGPESLYRH